MIRTYIFDYAAGDAECSLKVDLSKFTKESATELLEFFTWEYDKDADPIDELMNKYAMKAIQIATAEGWNEYGVKEWFDEQEGFIALDGSQGVELIHIQEYFFDEALLECEIVED